MTNSGIIPVALTFEAKVLSQADGNLVLTDLDPAQIQIKLHQTSARVEPHSSRTFDYDIKCDRCAVVLFASVTPIQKIKADPDTPTMKVVMHFGESIYVCDKAKGCRTSFLDAWKLSENKPSAQ